MIDRTLAAEVSFWPTSYTESPVPARTWLKKHQVRYMMATRRAKRCRHPRAAPTRHAICGRGCLNPPRNAAPAWTAPLHETTSQLSASPTLLGWDALCSSDAHGIPRKKSKQRKPHPRNGLLFVPPRPRSKLADLAVSGQRWMIEETLQAAKAGFTKPANGAPDTDRPPSTCRPWLSSPTSGSAAYHPAPFLGTDTEQNPPTVPLLLNEIRRMYDRVVLTLARAGRAWCRRRLK